MYSCPCFVADRGTGRLPRRAREGVFENLRGLGRGLLRGLGNVEKEREGGIRVEGCMGPLARSSETLLLSWATWTSCRSPSQIWFWTSSIVSEALLGMSHLLAGAGHPQRLLESWSRYLLRGTQNFVSPLRNAGCKRGAWSVGLLVLHAGCSGLNCLSSCGMG